MHPPAWRLQPLFCGLLPRSGARARPPGKDSLRAQPVPPRHFRDPGAGFEAFRHDTDLVVDRLAPPTSRTGDQVKPAHVPGPPQCRPDYIQAYARESKRRFGRRVIRLRTSQKTNSLNLQAILLDQQAKQPGVHVVATLVRQASSVNNKRSVELGKVFSPMTPLVAWKIRAPRGLIEEDKDGERSAS
jgi:hypothetical protein